MGNTNKTSLIWKIEKETLQKIVDESSIINDIMIRIGLAPTSGASRDVLKKRFKEDQIDLSKYTANSRKRRLEITTNLHNTSKIPEELLFTENCKTERSVLRNRIIKDKLLDYKCSICSNNGTHNNLHLSLHIDHINGINNDNRLENLRFLCPNCHSQTSTFGGKNRTTYTPGTVGRRCQCGKKITSKATNCRKCVVHTIRSKIGWPTPEVLQKLLWEKSILDISKELDVSNTSISKYIKKYNLNTPPIGFWSRK